MVRRTTRILALVVTLLLVSPAAALAYNVGSDGTISASTDALTIRVGFSIREDQPDRLLVRVAGEDRDRVRADCVRDCRTQLSGGSSRFELPVTARGGEFGSLTNRVPNGEVTFDVRGSRRVFGGREEFTVGTFTTTIDVPGSAVSSLTRTVSGDKVSLSWKGAPEAGISGYRVERVTGGGTTKVTTTSGTSATDEPGPGEHRYRVITVRPKAGSGSHETVSSPVTAVVEEAEEASDDGNGSNGSNGSSGSSGSSGSNGSNGSDAPNGSSSTDGSNGSSTSRATAPEVSEDGDDGAEADSSRRAADRDRGRTRTGQAPSVGRERGGFGIPELPRVGDIFRGELDFEQDGDADAEREEGDEVVLSAPSGSSGSFLGSAEEAERIAIPIAGGLLLTAIGLHLWRWLKVPLP